MKDCERKDGIFERDGWILVHQKKKNVGEQWIIRNMVTFGSNDLNVVSAVTREN